MLVDPESEKGETYYETLNFRNYSINPQKLAAEIANQIGRDMKSKFSNPNTAFFLVMNEERIPRQDRLFKYLITHIPKERLIVLSGNSFLDISPQMFREAIERKNLSFDKKKLRIEGHGETVIASCPCLPDMMGNLVRALDIPELRSEFSTREPKIHYDKERGTLRNIPFVLYKNLFRNGRRLEINPRTTEILYGIPAHKIKKTAPIPGKPRLKVKKKMTLFGRRRVK
ncbi:MAG: hypothetical protein V1494_04640 [Candidatus Diapherotrites archaeon]